MKNAIHKFIFTAVPTEQQTERSYDVDHFVGVACIIIGCVLATFAAFGKL